MKSQPIKYDLPINWSSALINNDWSGMDKEETKVLKQWLELNSDLADCVDCSADYGFSKYHDATSVYPFACDVTEFTFFHKNG